MKKYLPVILIVLICACCFLACEDSTDLSGVSVVTASPNETAGAEVADGQNDLLLNKGELKTESYTDEGNASDVVYDATVAETDENDLKTPGLTDKPVDDGEEMLELQVGTSYPTETSPPPTIVPTRRPSYQNTPTAIITPVPTSSNSGVTVPNNPDIDCIAIDFRGGVDDFWDFSEGYYYIRTAFGSEHDCYLDAVDPVGGEYGYLTVEIEGNDPFFYLYDLGGEAHYPQSAEFNIQSMPIIKIVMKNETSASSFDFFLFNQNGNCTEAEKFTVSGISTNDTEFKTYYIDLRASGASNSLTVTKGSASLNRTFSAIRFDAPGTSGEVGIQYIGMFKNVSDAQAYR